MIEADPRELGKSDSEDSKVDAGNAEPEGEEADDRAGERGDRRRDQKADPRRDPVASEQRRGDVSTETGIEGVAERKLAGEAHHDVPGLAGESEIEDNDQDRDEIIADEPGRGD